VLALCTSYRRHPCGGQKPRTKPGRAVLPPLVPRLNLL
jgi:hypothetical protein